MEKKLLLTGLLNFNDTFTLVNMCINKWENGWKMPKIITSCQIYDSHMLESDHTHLFVLEALKGLIHPFDCSLCRALLRSIHVVFTGLSGAIQIPRVIRQMTASLKVVGWIHSLGGSFFVAKKNKQKHPCLSVSVWENDQQRTGQYWLRNTGTRLGNWNIWNTVERAFNATKPKQICFSG